MSETPKRPYAQVMCVAEVLVDSLRVHCRRIEIAGSLRRKSPMCGDIEIVAIPILHTNLLGEPLETSEVDDWLANKPLELRKNGHRYKQFSFEWQPRLWFKVDLFLQPDPATWAVNFLLRTGSATFSKQMVTSVAYGGFKPDEFEVRDARVWRRGVALELEDEQEIFDLWQMGYVEPKDRL